MTDEPIGAILKRLREAAGMTKAELRRASGVSYDTINKLEAGSQSSTSPTNLAALADILGDELLPNRGKAGFSEPGGPYKSTAARILADVEPAQPPMGDAEKASKPSALSVNEIKIATVGNLAQVVATIDRQGIAKLREKLDALEAMLDD